MSIIDLSGERRRQLIDTQQVYEVWREANQEANRRFGGSMRWVHLTRLQALWHPFTPEATLIYQRTGNLRMQLLLGHTKIESTVRYLGIEVDDALSIAS